MGWDLGCGRLRTKAYNPSHRNQAHPANSHNLAASSKRRMTFHAFLRQSYDGKSGHCWDRARSRSRVRMYEGKMGGCRRR